MQTIKATVQYQECIIQHPIDHCLRPLQVQVQYTPPRPFPHRALHPHPALPLPHIHTLLPPITLPRRHPTSAMPNSICGNSGSSSCCALSACTGACEGMGRRNATQRVVGFVGSGVVAGALGLGGGTAVEVEACSEGARGRRQR
jgi:hypothetical protein